MCQRRLVLSLRGVMLALSLVVPAAHAQTSQPPRTQPPMQTQERVYGSQIMTPQERLEYRRRMASAESRQERERIRIEHHRRMQMRAQERGLALPDVPPYQGGGMGPGRGMGGMGPGGGVSGGRR